MSIPDFQTIMLPLMKHVADGQEHSFRSLVEALAADFKLTDAERRKLLPSSGYPLFDDRVSWARTFLKHAGLLSAPKKGIVQIAERGLNVLRTNPQRIDNKFLRQFPEFVEFQGGKKAELKEEAGVAPSECLDPRETIEEGYQQIQKQLSAELLQRIKTNSPEFFEKLVLDLLVKMGYGGSRRDAAEHLGKCGDQGVDGLIKQDELGLDGVYIQAKRWDGQVGSKEINAFVGALHGKKAHKGVFITTSDFSDPAREYVRGIEDKVVLINGEQLADLMITHCVGVATIHTYDIKKIDDDYFVEE